VSIAHPEPNPSVVAAGEVDGVIGRAPIDTVIATGARASTSCRSGAPGCPAGRFAAWCTAMTDRTRRRLAPALNWKGCRAARGRGVPGASGAVILVPRVPGLLPAAPGA
jgi:hypothetical protein